MEFRVLGPVEAWHGGRRVPLGGPKPRALLAALLLEFPRVVSADRLIDLLWDERPPGSARASIQTYVSTLRRGLTVPGQPEVIETRPPGYLLQLREDQLDQLVFDRLVGEGRSAARAGRADEAAQAFGDALKLWHGDSLGGIGEALRTEAAALDHKRLEVTEERVAAELLLGRYGATVAELTALVGAHPLRERARGQLMTALYGLGRQSEALAVYHEGRRALSAELGLDPGPDLQRLHATILRGEPLAQESPPVTIAEAQGRAVIPAQLPPSVPDFTGRDELVGEIVDGLVVAGNAPPVFVICGKGGVGKSALAVFVAHAVSGAYPDGQLFADMRGCTDLPAGPEEVLARFLRALGVEPGSLPDSFQDRLDLYRSLLSQRRVLVVLDDARSERQVRPLLPAGRGCAVLVTARGRFPGLGGARAIDLEVMAEPAALDLLAGIVGSDRVAAERAAAGEIVRLCGGLPLAVRTAGGRLNTRRHWPLSMLVDRLSDERWRLDELSAGDLEVRSSVAFSYRLLDEEAKAAFRRLAVLGGPDFPAWIAAPLLDLPPRAAEDVVERLVDAQLLDFVAVDAVGQVRYRLHELLRVYARERAQQEESEADLRAAVGRVLGNWVFLISRIAERTPPGEIPLRREYSTARPVDDDLVRRLPSDPVAWLEAETPALIAAVERAAGMDLDVAACDLSVALSFSVFFVGPRLAEWSRSHDAALAAARRSGNQMGEATLLAAHGQIYYEMDRYEEATTYFEQALSRYASAGDVRGEAAVLAGMGNARREQCRLREALTHLGRAVEIFRTLGDDAAIGHAARLSATVHLELGDFDRLPPLLAEALAAYRRVGSRRGEALTVRTIGLAYRAVGDHDRAEQACEAALRMFHELGDQFMAAYGVQALAKTRIRLGRGEAMLAPLEEALEVCRGQLDRWGQALLRRTIGELHLAGGRLVEARTELAAAIALSDALGTPLPAARARRDLATVLDLAGDSGQAEVVREQAIEMFRRYEARELAELTGADGAPARLDLPW
ncbi:BTAD domain-containing putative transcriptional regulator [Acrocarpospora sp. B8E8]|uniref:AfsR/SARP family transcriptional regulator n=1 Tax=Acrocarpospora sp. B8E8 TaxID=3153572 RepID=UPI00325E8AD4